ncbi:hypothetical protein EV643_12157 [Kribbella sp. VKM Ac-2527]|uniref:Secreted protein n=1 Tax=Kribbella caucasensis TaxID=2512215 RepID=A0A4R6JMD6_9ACTN|nr:hypothetical protein [Kribbella sp. VKM Ac-2527]TDO35785.1 hypothetical protein EV643_12157 [Kribbella sp. VKM Ac-2527]
MSEASRRGFLVIAGTGAAATVGAAVAGTQYLLDNDKNELQPKVQDLSAADLASAESFVVHVKDVRTGQLAILVDQREVLVTDRELAARLANATS